MGFESVFVRCTDRDRIGRAPHRSLEGARHPIGVDLYFRQGFPGTTVRERLKPAS